MEGRPLVFTDGPIEQGTMDVLSMRVDHMEEIGTLVGTLKERPELKAVHLFAKDVDAVWKAFKEPYEFVAAAGGVVMDEQGRLLAIRRLGKWDLPKGKVEKGEDLPTAAIREVQEECGVAHLHLREPLAETWHTYERKDRQYLKCTSWFLMNGSCADPLTAQHEEGIEEVRWLDREGVDRMIQDTYLSLLPVIRAWQQRTT